MNKVAAIVLLAFSYLTTFAQNRATEKAKPIVEEGKRLYRVEMASWLGTDLFLEKYEDRSNIGGYFSYEDKDSVRCVFFARFGSPKVIGMITFDSSYNVETASKDFSERKFTSTEFEL